MEIFRKGLVFFFIFLCFSHVSASHRKLVSVHVQERRMETITRNEVLSIRKTGRAINTVVKRGGGGAGRGSSGGGAGRGRSYGGGNDGVGISTPKPRLTPGNGALIPLYGAGSGNRHNTNHHSGASGPKQVQVGFRRLGTDRVAVLAPLVLMLVNAWL